MADLLIDVFETVGVLALPPSPFDVVTVTDAISVGQLVHALIDVADTVTVAEDALPVLLSDSPFRQAAVANASQVTVPMATVQRNALAVFVRWASATITLTTVSDTDGNLYTLVQNPVTLGSGVRCAAAVAIQQSSGTTPTLFANFSATPSGVWMAVHEVTQRDLLAPVDGSAGQVQISPSGTDAVSSGPFTTTRDGAYIFGGSTESGVGAITDPGTGFLERTRDLPVSVGFITEDQVQASAGSVSATFTGEAPGIAYATIGLALQYARMWRPELADTVTVTDVVAMSLGPTAAVAEAVTVTETVTLALSLVLLDVSDAVAVTENVAGNIADAAVTMTVFDLVLLEGSTPPFIVAVESITVTDLNLQALQGVSVADGITITETLTVRMSMRISVFDDVAMVLVPEAFEAVTITESTSLTFATFAARQISVNDLVTLTEAVATRFHPMLANVNDAVAVTEVRGVVVTSLRLDVVDSVTVTDGVTVSLGQQIASVFDAVAVTETVALILQIEGVLALTVNDEVLLTEFVDIFGAPNIIVFDAVTVTEQITIAVAQLKLDVFDAVTVTDVASLSVGALGGIAVSDDVALTESVAARLSLLRVESFENINVGEGRDVAFNLILLDVFDPVLVGETGTPLVGERQPVPRIRGMFAWERWIRREP